MEVRQERSFLKERTKKPWPFGPSVGQIHGPTDKSFLLLFFKKEVLSCLGLNRVARAPLPTKPRVTRPADQEHQKCAQAMGNVARHDNRSAKCYSARLRGLS